MAGVLSDAFMPSVVAEAVVFRPATGGAEYPSADAETLDDRDERHVAGGVYENLPTDTVEPRVRPCSIGVRLCISGVRLCVSGVPLLDKLGKLPGML
mmetsp:Transcript_123067/g.223790  ORF Transcript_123067/g.223790 Transcript_123067/m.223790 type:complete len:97 (+) Transcript_123067:2476-2766(+)